MPKLKWFTWSSLLGAGIASWGLLWLVIWSFVRHDSRIFWLTSDIRTPMAARLMVWIGALLFVMGSSAGLFSGSKKVL
jgi:hypothetical protein